MNNSNWADEDTAKAKAIWADYQRQHDVSQWQGKAVGIDPKSGRVWFGESGIDIYDQMEKEGTETPIYLLRVGSNYYLRKGAHARKR